MTSLLLWSSALYGLYNFFYIKERRMKFMIRMNDGSDISENVDDKVSFLFNQRNIVNTLVLQGHSNIKSSIHKNKDNIVVITTIFYRSNITWDIDCIQLPGAYIISSIVYER